MEPLGKTGPDELFLALSFCSGVAMTGTTNRGLLYLPIRADNIRRDGRSVADPALAPICASLFVDE